MEAKLVFALEDNFTCCIESLNVRSVKCIVISQQAFSTSHAKSAGIAIFHEKPVIQYVYTHRYIIESKSI